MTTAKSKKEKTSKEVPSSGKKASQKGSKEKTSKNEKLDEHTASTAGSKAVKKDLKYIYPEDIKTGAQKKAFRTKCRAARKKFIRDIKKMEAKGSTSTAAEIESKQTEYRKFRKENYNPKAVAEGTEK